MTKIELQKIKPMVDQLVERKLAELLGDPDSGLEIRESVRKRLVNSLQSKTSGTQVEKVAKKLDLHC